jgi:hypothetical protein
MSPTTTSMRLISFNTPENELKGFHEIISVSQSIRSVSKGKYIITAKECDYLQSRKIPYHIEEYL